MWKINTSNPGKQAEYKRLFEKHGQPLEITTEDLPEIDADPLSVIVHKASQFKEDEIIVEDTVLDVEGAEIGVNIRWLLKHLSQFAGHKAIWTVYLAYKKDNKVYVYKEVIEGVIVQPRGDNGFGHDPYFQPQYSKFTLAESKPDTLNARALAVDALLEGKIHAILPPMTSWNGKWQEST